MLIAFGYTRQIRDYKLSYTAMKPITLNTILISLLVLSNQCSSNLISRQINKEDVGSIEELKVAKRSDLSDQLSLLQFSMFGKPYSFKLILANSIFSPNFQIMQRNLQNRNIQDYQTVQNSEKLEGSFYTDEHGRGSFYIQQEHGKIELDGVVDDLYMITSSKSTASRRKLQHDVATIELLIFLDQIVSKNLIEKDTSIKKYLGIFWNAVQNQYKIFSSPKVQFSLSSAIVIDDMPWMTDAFLEPNKPDAIEFVSGFGIWMYKEKQNENKFPQFDIALVHTGFDLSGKDGDTIETGTLGIASIGGVCLDELLDDGKMMFSSVAAIEDFYAPAFSMTNAAAHEIGHLLSADHDDPSKCDEHGIMSPADQPVSQSTKSDNASCLFDSPQPHIPMGPEIPLMTRDEVCKMSFGDSFDALSTTLYSETTDPCVFVLCAENEDYNNIKYVMWVPEGTDCSDDGEKVCTKGNSGYVEYADADPLEVQQYK
uniref:Peptidase M12B domain-containing protein n=1 Tax=Strigamia maritima TaxID=126957 RepID=T1J944_STRMM